MYYAIFNMHLETYVVNACPDSSWPLMDGDSRHNSHCHRGAINLLRGAINLLRGALNLLRGANTFGPRSNCMGMHTVILHICTLTHCVPQ